MSEFAAFALFGLFCGFVFGTGDTLHKLIFNDVVTYIVDVLSVLICTLVFFCLYVSYLDGYVRFYCVAVILLTMFAYLFTIHKKVSKKACKLKSRYNIMLYRRKNKKGGKVESKSR